MTDQPRRRLRAIASPRRVGEPNVLSNEATPNRLSTMGTSGRPVSAATAATQPDQPSAQPPIRTALPPPAIVSGRSASPPSASPPARRRALPSLGTLLFIGFAVFWALRLFNNFGGASSGATTAPAPGGTVETGVVTFGQGRGDDCDLTDESAEFPLSADVWWRAELRAPQPEEATVVVLAYRDDGQIDRYEIPPEAETGDWEILCSGDAVAGYQAGRYRIEIWDEAETMLLAVGTYQKKALSQ